MQQEGIILFQELCFAPDPGEVTPKLCFGDKQMVYGMPMAWLSARPKRNMRIWGVRGGLCGVIGGGTIYSIGNC
jgi:hypothetical protein